MIEPGRRARHKGTFSSRQATNVDGVKAVDVLFWRDRLDHALVVDMAGNWELAEDAVHGRIGIELLDQRQQVGLAGLDGQPMLEGLHATFDGLAALVAHVDPGSPDPRRQV